MKRVWLFFLAGLFLVGVVSAANSCSSPDQIILKLSETTNAHGALGTYEVLSDPVVKLYRCYNSIVDDYMISRYSDCEVGLGSGIGWALEGDFGYLYDQQVAGTVFMRRCYHPTTVDHIVIRDDLETCPAGYIAEGLVGYAYVSAEPDTFESDRCYNPTTEEYMRTADGAACPVGYSVDTADAKMYVMDNAPPGEDENYGVEICYDDIFGSVYSGANSQDCSGKTPFLWLSEVYNAHASTTQSVAYNTGVCYGGLSCAVRDNACNAGEEMVVALSSISNAHLSDPDYLPSGAVAYWKLDGDAIDSVGSNSGVNNGVSFIGGQVGRAGDFDGVGDYVEIADDNSLDLEGPFTIEAWFKMRTTPGADSPYIFIKRSPGGSAKDSNYELFVTSTNQAQFIFADGSTSDNIVSDPVLGLGIWTHVVVVYDGSNLVMYIDGDMDKTKSVTIAPRANDVPLRIGTYVIGTQFFDGQIDEVVVYDRALIPQEIQHRYNVGAYEKKVCCGVSAASAIRWENMDGVPITTSNIGQWVRMVKTSASSGDFEVREDDGASGDDDLYVGANAIAGVNENGNRVGTWHITQADFDVADEGGELNDDQIEAYFTIGTNVSGNLNISDEYIDYPMNVTLESPTCGENFTVGTTTEIKVIASDPNDKIMGNVTVNGVKIMEFSNGGNQTQHTWSTAGNIQVEVFANNSRGYIRRTITSIMVTDSSTKDYIAACINKPADFSDITTSNVRFEANSSRGLKCILGVCDEVNVTGLWFSWRFSDGLINFNHDGSDINGLAYNFYKNFATAGHNWAVLDVKMV